MAVLVGLRSGLVRTVQVVRVDVRVVTAGVAVHLEARMNGPVRSEEDCRQGGRNGADASAQRLHPARRLPHHRWQSQQPNEKKGNPNPRRACCRNATDRCTRHRSTATPLRLPLPGHFFITGGGEETMRRLSLLDLTVILAVFALLLFVARVEFVHYTHGMLDPHAAGAPARAE